jgi:hypothetical protein
MGDVGVKAHAALELRNKGKQEDTLTTGSSAVLSTRLEEGRAMPRQRPG